MLTVLYYCLCQSTTQPPAEKNMIQSMCPSYQQTHWQTQKKGGKYHKQAQTYKQTYKSKQFNIVLTSSISAGPEHTTDARTGSKMQAVSGHSRPSAAYSASFSIILTDPCVNIHQHRDIRVMKESKTVQWQVIGLKRYSYSISIINYQQQRQLKHNRNSIRTVKKI